MKTWGCSSSRTLIVLLFLSLLTAGLSIKCYKCFYDDKHSDFPGSNKKCLEENFEDVDDDDVDIGDGFDRCYKAVVTDDDKIISAHRGGGLAILAEFASSVSRDADDFSIHYCKENLCNASSSPVTSLILLAVTLFLLRSLTS